MVEVQDRGRPSDRRQCDGDQAASLAASSSATTGQQKNQSNHDAPAPPAAFFNIAAGRTLPRAGDGDLIPRNFSTSQFRHSAVTSSTSPGKSAGINCTKFMIL